MNHHNWYCECRRCRRKSKRERRWFGRQVRRERKLRELHRELIELHHQRREELIRKLEASSLQIITP